MSKRFLALSLLSVLLLITVSQTPSVNAVPVTILNKGHYIIEWISEPETVDPAWAYDTSSGEIIANVYETLISFDREHVDQFVPALSTRVPNVTNGGIQFIDELDPETGIVWKERLTFPMRLFDAHGNPIMLHSGNTLTMADFEYSFERWMVQDRAGGPSWMIYEPVEGIGYYHAFDYTDDPVVQGKIIDHAFQVSGTNFIINLAVPYAPILGILAQYWASILDKAYIISHVPADWDGNWGDYTEWVNHHNPPESPLNVMSGTGPYAGPGPYINPTHEIGYWTHGVEWSIVKFEDYWRGWPYKEASDYLFRVTEKLVYEWPDRLADFKVGTADTVYVPRQYLEWVRGWPGIRGFPDLPPGAPWGLPSLQAYAMFFNFRINPDTPYAGSQQWTTGIPLDFFSDVHVRRGFAYAFDHARHIEEAWLGEAVQPSSPVIEGMPYHIDVPTYTFDPTFYKAAAELSMAWGGVDNSSPPDGDALDPGDVPGDLWVNGFYFKLPYITGDNWMLRAALMIRENIALTGQIWGAPGTFSIQTLGISGWEYVNAIWYYPTHRSILPIFMFDWFADYADPHSFVMPFMHSQGDLVYPSSYSNSTVDDLIEDGIETPDGSWRAIVYRQLQQLYYEDVPSVMLAQPLGRRWERDWVQGWYYNPLLAVSVELVSGPYFYHLWKGLNGDVNGDNEVNVLDAGLINDYYYDPPFYGPQALIEGYRVKYDIAPYLQYQIDKLPPPGDSVGTIDLMDRAVINAHFGETTDP